MNRFHDQSIARVELVVKGEYLSPSSVTAILATPPTRSFAKGDVVSRPNGEGKRPWGLWALEFGGTEVQEAAIHLLDALRGKEEHLKNVADMPGVQVSIAIWWDPAEGQGGFTLLSATLVQLCTFGTQIHFYFPG